VYPIPNTVVSDSGRVIAYADQEMARLEAAGSTYLDGLAAMLQHAPIERVVRFGSPSREIQIEAESFGADLIVLTTRLHTMLRFPWSRRTAARVVRKSEVRVLLLSR
jgi:nucleotide-binding universal stress UspA family protein